VPVGFQAKHPGGEACMTDTEPTESRARRRASRQPEFLSVVKDVVLVFALYLYFAGWLHAYYFFQQFGVSLNSVDIPVYYFFIYSFSVFLTFWGFVVLVVVIISLTLAVKGRPSWGYLLVIALISLFPGIFYAARAAGMSDASEKRSGYASTVQFVFKKDAAETFDEEFIDLNKNDRLQLLTVTKDRYLVFCQPKGEGDAQPNATMYSIAAADVALAKVDLPSPSD
jgi:hypothetical protein